jgi:hypothetical protein
MELVINNLPSYTSINIRDAVCVVHIFHLTGMLTMFTKKVLFTILFLLCNLCILLFIDPENHLDITVPLTPYVLASYQYTNDTTWRKYEEHILL